MSQNLADIGPQAHVAKVVHHGEQLTVPSGMSIDAAIDLLNRRKKYLTEKVVMSENFDVFPWDGAYALDKVLTRRYGWAPAESTCFNPACLISIEVGPGVTCSVPWGQFSLPNVSGTLNCSSTQSEGRVIFKLVAQVTREAEPTIRSIFEDLRAELKISSIYRGKAFKMRFLDNSGDVLGLPEPKFIDVSDAHPADLILSADVEFAVRTNLFTPITRVSDCLRNDIPVKRGILLGGRYGTGKTMAAKVAANLAVQSGITYLYVQRAAELSYAVAFAKQYQSPACVIFCEDIDRALDGKRDVEMDDILNIIDGIDTKTSNIIVVLTTNNLSGINPAMLRPGRLDAVIEVLPPDAAAVEKLIRHYAGPAIDPEMGLSSVGTLLAGQIPAVVAEVVKRAKLAQLTLEEPGATVSELSPEALVAAARSMRAQLALMEGNKPAAEPELDTALGNVLGKVLTNGFGDALAKKVGKEVSACL